MARLSGRVVIATHNSGKLTEMAALLAPYGIDAVSAGSLGLPEPDETGSTFAANAALKARAAATAANLPALSDDSGLCVDALDGAPGIYSARWGGPNKDFAAAMKRIERELQARGAKPPFAAHFVCVLGVAWPDGHEASFEGKVFGTLRLPPVGTLGFGYDPIFTPQGRDVTFGEMPASVKHGVPSDGSPGVSHRVRAFQALARHFLA